MSEPLAQSPATVSPEPKKKASFLRTLKSIAWAFLGVRKAADYQDDIQTLNIFHIIFVGIAACFVFVLALMFLVQWAVH